MSGWWVGVFWALLIPLVIVLGIVYGTTRKLYRLVQVLAVFTYIIFVSYTIDAFNLNRDWILGLLALSTALLIGAGYYVAKQNARPEAGFAKGAKKARKAKRSSPVWILLLLAIIIVAVVIALAGRLTVTLQAIESVDRYYFEEKTSLDAVTVSYENPYFLPLAVPDEEKFTHVCVFKEEGAPFDYLLSLTERTAPVTRQEPQLEISPGEKVTITYAVTDGVEKPIPIDEKSGFVLRTNPLKDATKIVLLGNDKFEWVPCEQYASVKYVEIPVTE